MYTLTFLVVAQFSIVVHPWKCRELTSHVFSTVKENKKTKKKKKKPLFFLGLYWPFLLGHSPSPPPPHILLAILKNVFFFSYSINHSTPPPPLPQLLFKRCVYLNCSDCRRTLLLFYSLSFEWWITVISLSHLQRLQLADSEVVSLSLCPFLIWHCMLLVP